jgi:thymidylate synthase
MKTITCRNVNDGFAEALWYMRIQGVREDTRNGPVKSAVGPVIVEFTHPWERTHFCATRDANPFFHVMEAMWMLAGRNDVKWPASFAANIANYSDNGLTLHGAYGYRWLNHFGPDQIEAVIEHLKEDRETRRAVINMWDPISDLRMVKEGGKDVPCNTHIYFRPRGAFLDMTVCNRSNDLVWGLFGANVVHMSFLHEFIAAATGFQMGSYFQMTNNLHVYEQHWNLLEHPPVPLQGAGAVRVPLTDDGDYAKMYSDLCWFLNAPDAEYRYHNSWFPRVLKPMYFAHKLYKQGKLGEAIDQAALVEDADWSAACCLWLSRRANKKDQPDA